MPQKSLDFKTSDFPSLATTINTPQTTIWNNSEKLSEVKIVKPVVPKNPEKPAFHKINTHTPQLHKPHNQSLENEITRNMRNTRYKRVSFLPDTNYKETLDDDYDSDYDFDDQNVHHWDENDDYESD